MTERARPHVPGTVRMSRRGTSLYDLGMANHDTSGRSLAGDFARGRSDG